MASVFLPNVGMGISEATIVKWCKAVGDTVDVIISGVYPVIAAGSITANNLITSGGTDGTAIAESAGSGVLVGVLGPALEDGVSGDRVATVINPFIKQGG